MPELQNSRRKLQIAIVAMIVADVIAVAVLFSPLVGSAESRLVAMSELRADLQRKTRDAQPLIGLDKKIVLAKSQITQFYHDRFASTDSDLATALGKLASQNGVRILQVKYKQEDVTGAGVIPVDIEGTFSGDYLQLIKFINAVERSKQFFTVDSVDLAGETTGTVKLDVKMHSFLHAGA
jgi:Tfp pilus assembly protein PilO